MTLLTYQQAAERLAVSAATVRRLIETGALPAVRIGRPVRIDPADLTALIHTKMLAGIFMEACFSITSTPYHTL